MQILPWLPGYMWDGKTLKSTGACLPPTQHVNPKNGELLYYCLPMWDGGGKVGVYIRHLGLVEAVS